MKGVTVLSVYVVINTYLQDKGITQASISHKTQITQNALNLSLNGKRKLSLDEYVDICDALEVPYDLFITKSKEGA